VRNPRTETYQFAAGVVSREAATQLLSVVHYLFVCCCQDIKCLVSRALTPLCCLLSRLWSCKLCRVLLYDIFFYFAILSVFLLFIKLSDITFNIVLHLRLQSSLLCRPVDQPQCEAMSYVIVKTKVIFGIHSVYFSA